MIISCGEALIDMVPHGSGDNLTFAPCPGGAPFNVARAVARLGSRSGFLGGLARDSFGQMLSHVLEDDHVSLKTAIRRDYPTALAFVTFDDDNEPHYQFYLDGSATTQVGNEDLPDIPADATAYIFGGVSLALDPVAASMEKLMGRVKGKLPIIMDPNIRPLLIPERDAYVARLERLIKLADLIKISAVDLEWLSPGQSAEDAARDMAARSGAVVILTSGSDGAVVYTDAGQNVTAPSTPPKITVVDTVGAGDCFLGGVTAWLDQNGLLGGDLNDIGDKGWAAALDFANAAAALSCTRAGAVPPTVAEMKTTYPQLNFGKAA